ncbi:hypothetical protein B0H10DRAFT_1952633 [Mycena sp. CBHHK59/15]|nr:hypothetical protein B0H10DRAFT_1952633 [Mycena sp. CBHHK59/15]
MLRQGNEPQTVNNYMSGVRQNGLIPNSITHSWPGGVGGAGGAGGTEGGDGGTGEGPRLYYDIMAGHSSITMNDHSTHITNYPQQTPPPGPLPQFQRTHTKYGFTIDMEEIWRLLKLRSGLISNPSATGGEPAEVAFFPEADPYLPPWGPGVAGGEKTADGWTRRLRVSSNFEDYGNLPIRLNVSTACADPCMLLWDSNVYTGLRRFQEEEGFYPDTPEYAIKFADCPLFEVCDTRHADAQTSPEFLPKISLGPKNSKNFGNVINFGEYSHKDLLEYVTFSLQFVIPKPEVFLATSWSNFSENFL